MSCLIRRYYSKEKPKLNKKYIAWAMGVGLALFAAHNANQPLIEYAFLPVVGLAIVVVCVITSLDKWRPDNLGPKWVWIPMLVIVSSLWLRLIVDFSKDTVFGGVIGLLFFSIYLVSRTLGKQTLEVFMPLVIIEAVSVITYGIIWPGIKNGGIITSHGNYDIATGFLIFGLVVSAVRYQWWLSAIVLVALFFTGADEAIFACVVLGVVILARRDWSRKMLLPVGALVITLIVCTTLGITQQLYFPSTKKLAMAKEAVEDTSVGRGLDKVVPDKWLEPINKVAVVVEVEKEPNPIERASNERIGIIQRGIINTKPLGNGLNLTEYWREEMPHNVPVIISHQIGPIAAIAWLFIIFMGLVKTKHKYAFTAIFALSVFDHFLWTQVAPWWWALVGVATVSEYKNDLIFKEMI